MARLVSELSLPHGVKRKLEQNKYSTCDDLKDIQAGDLSAELSIALSQAEDIVRQVNTATAGQDRRADTTDGLPAVPPIRSTPASSLLANIHVPHFSTKSRSLDRLIQRVATSTPGKEDIPADGEDEGDAEGLAPGMAIEITGPPGSGKSAVCVALALSARMELVQTAQVNGEQSSVYGEVLYIDTEGAAPPERFKSAAESLTRNIQHSATDIISGLHYARIATQLQMIAFLNILDDWLVEHPKVNLVIIDTLSFHFRQPNMDMKARSRIMELVKQQVGKATTVHNCAVVITTQLATKLLTADNKPANFDTGDRAVLMPQLGDSWTTAKTIRIVLFRGKVGNEVRYAHGSTSAGHLAIPWVKYEIDHDGIPCDLAGG